MKRTPTAIVVALCAAFGATVAETSRMFVEPSPTPGSSGPMEAPDLSSSGEIIEPVIRPELLRLVPTFPVTDLKRDSDFYTQRLGFKVELATASYVAVGRDGVQIGLAQDKLRTAPARMSCYINVNGVDAFYRKLVERKVKPVRGIATQPSKLREFMVLAPDNNSLIFGEYVGALTGN